jgi:hypothetical protein
MEVQLKSENRHIVDSGFLDTGGAVDYAAFNMCTTDTIARKIYIRDTVFWKLSEKDHVTFASIRNDVAILHQKIQFAMIGCETNNYGRTEIESLRRDYGMRIIPFNTVGKLTSKKIIQKGLTMEKNAIIKFTNSWRQNALDDPNNQMKLGQIVLPKKKTTEMMKWMNQLDSFVRKDPEGFATGLPKYAAEGSGHDDGIMAALGNIFMIKTKIFGIFGGNPAVAAIQRVGKEVGEPSKTPDRVKGIAVGHVEDYYFYQGM